MGGFVVTPCPSFSHSQSKAAPLGGSGVCTSMYMWVWEVPQSVTQGKPGDWHVGCVADCSQGRGHLGGEGAEGKLRHKTFLSSPMALPPNRPGPARLCPRLCPPIALLGPEMG